jgi:hypothetical protein
LIKASLTVSRLSLPGHPPKIRIDAIRSEQETKPRKNQNPHP